MEDDGGRAVITEDEVQLRQLDIIIANLVEQANAQLTS